MILQLSCFVFCIIGFIQCDAFNSNDIDTVSFINDLKIEAREPLFLTKYIEKGKLKEARKLATVQPFVDGVESFSGYLTVNKKYDSNLFFWYFKSETDYKNAPTVVWLQGGPGASMYIGLFNENGPLKIDGRNVLKRNCTWSKISNLIYFDNPVGTGYSFTKHDKGYATNQNEVGTDLYNALIQLYKLFPYLQKNDLFITGESYGGKYVPALGYRIHVNNSNKPKIFLNLKGLMIGDGLSDPLHMLNYADYLYQLGLIDDNAKKEFHNVELKTATLIRQHKWHKASDSLYNILTNGNSLFYKYIGFAGLYNYVDPIAGDWVSYETDFITSSYFRQRVHVGNLTLNDGSKVFEYLYEDIPKSVIDWVVELLKHYKVLYYNGQLDIICAYPLTENVLKHMKWPLSDEYKKAKRNIYEVNKNVAGYYKVAGNLIEVLIRDAGHMVPANQPVWAYQLFSDFIHNKFTSKDVQIKSNQFKSN